MVSFDHMDMDGYALRWGSDHIASSLADCGRRRHGEIWEIWTSSLATAAGGDMGRYGEIRGDMDLVAGGLRQSGLAAHA